MAQDKDTYLTDGCDGKTPSAKTRLEKTRARWVTIEPVVVFGIVGYASLLLVRPLYVKDVIMERYNVSSNASDDSGCAAANGSSGNHSVVAQVQAETSMWLLYLGMASGFPAVLTNVVLGIRTDSQGRKVAMVVPLVGYAAQTAVYLLVVQLRLPLPVLLVGEALQGLSGGFGLLFAGCISYLTDVTAPERRTLRIIVAETLVYLLGGLSQVGEGYLIRIGYVPAIGLAFACNALAILYVVIPPFLPETVERGGGGGAGSGSVGLAAAWRGMGRLLAYNENGRRWQMLLLDFFIFFVIIQALGLPSIIVLYGTAPPFCWSSGDAGIATAISLVSASLGMVIGYKAFSFCVNDYWQMQISCLSTGISTLVLALAHSTDVIYVGVSLGLLKGIAVPVARSVLSRIARPGEIGATFAIVGCLESLSSFISNAAATSLYSATVSFLPPLTFYIYSASTIIPMGLTLLLQIFWSQKKDYELIRSVSSQE